MYQIEISSVEDTKLQLKEEKFWVKMRPNIRLAVYDANIFQSLIEAKGRLTRLRNGSASIILEPSHS